jgi:hypothetical protein
MIPQNKNHQRPHEMIPQNKNNIIKNTIKILRFLFKEKIYILYYILYHG